MKVTQEMMDQMLSEAMPDIVASFKKQITDGVSWSVLEAARTECSKFVLEWVNVNVLPEIEKSLVESKDGLAAMGAKLGENVVGLLAESLTDQVKDRLSNSWERSKIFESLFK